MIDRHIHASAIALRRGWSALHLQMRALAARTPRSNELHQHRRHLRRLLTARRSILIRTGLTLGVVVAIVGVTLGGLWLRLLSGPLSVDVVTPWLTSAVEERLGGHYRIEVGGTQLERDETGRTALRLRDIIVRDNDGAIVATAPKAEVAIAGSALLSGRLRAERLSLIGAEMAIRIENDGQVTIFAGADKRPLTTTTVPRTPATTPAAEAVAAAAPAPAAMAALLAWLSDLDALGLDGQELTEIGLKNGSLVVDDRRSGKQLSFANINIAVARPREGGVALSISSSGTDGPWSLTATVSPHADGRRSIEAVVRDVSPKDLLLALRLGGGEIQADLPLSARVRVELGADGTMQSARGTIVAGAGILFESADKKARVLIDEAQIDVRWDSAARQVVIPIEIQSGPNRISVLAHLEPPTEPNGPWLFGVSRGRILLAGVGREPPLLLDRVSMRGRFDPTRKRVELEQGELGGVAASVAVTAAVDYSSADPHVTLGVAGTRMPASALKRLWPIIVNPDVRTWVADHVQSGTVERVVVATNAPLSTMQDGGPPMPADGLFVEVAVRGTVLRPVEKLPPIRDADVLVRVTGRAVSVSMERGIADLPSGRKLSITGGLFEVADSYIKPAPSRTRFRIEGPADAAAELMQLEPLRGASGVALDPATTHGTIAGQVTISVPLLPNPPKEAWTYNIDAEVTNFAADKLVRGYKAEANTLRISATAQGFLVKGDVKIAGTPANLEYRKVKADADPEWRLQATIDDAGRTRLGYDVGANLIGPVGVKLSGKIVPPGREPRFSVDADLTHAKISDLLPAWSKPAGKAVRVSMTVIDKAQSTRFEDIVIDGSGAAVKGSLEIDSNGDVMNANFPSFALSDGDKVSLKADRTSDGVLRVVMRGDVYDGRGFVQTQLAGPADPSKPKKPPVDVDLDIKVGAVAGFNGEALRSVELRMTRRASNIRAFTFSAKLGRDASLIGDLRRGGNRQVVYLETNDAGALFRFTDTYPRMNGGQMWVAMDPPAGDLAPQDGILNIRNFAVRGEAALEGVAGADASRQSNVASGIIFERLRVEFTRSPGKLAIRDGVVKGPMIGGTIEGVIDYSRSDVRLRGTFVPFFGLNNVFGNIPLVGPILGGSNEGLLGVTYEVVGPPNAPLLRVNPASVMVPGVFRKIFEFRGADDRSNMFETQSR